MIGRIARASILAATGIAMLGAAPPALAQDNNDEARIRKLEAEVRALQRRVFPGGDGRFFEAEITGQPRQQQAAGQVSTTALTDVLARLDALEGQIQRLTAQNEEQAFALRQLTARVDALVDRPAIAAQPVQGSAQSTGQSSATRTVPTGGSNTTRAATSSTPAAAAAPSASRVAAVQAIAKPQTDDAGDDEYSYGFRLWDAGYYPEAQQQLTLFLDKHPDHWRATYARNLLGRAYLDDKKPVEAAPWFLKNYQTDKAGRRAGDSLLYLAVSMAAQGDERRACIALSEFAETYPALASGRLQSDYERQRATVKCN